MKNFQLKRSDFNIKKNLSYLFDRPESNHFAVIDGLRALATVWVISFHCVYFSSLALPGERFHFIVASPWVQWMIQGHLALDVFFVISGFVISHLLIQEWSHSGEIRVKRFYSRRVMRIFPAYLAALLFCYLFLPNKAENIWTNILLINNYLPALNQFMPWSWTIAVEMHFYFVIPFIILFCVKSPKQRFLIISVLLIIASVLIRTFLIARENIAVPIPIHPVNNFENYLAFHDHLYDKTHTRFSPFVWGAGAAALFHFSSIKTWLQTHVAIRKCLFALACLAIFSIGFTRLHAPSPWLINASDLYISGFRQIFSLAFAYLLLSVLLPTGQNSPLSNFLSARCWYPFSQLTYSIYLLHPTLIIFYYRDFVKADSFTVANIFMNISGLLLVSTFLAGLLYLFIERPFLNARKK